MRQSLRHPRPCHGPLRNPHLYGLVSCRYTSEGLVQGLGFILVHAMDRSVIPIHYPPQLPAARGPLHPHRCHHLLVLDFVRLFSSLYLTHCSDSFPARAVALQCQGMAVTRFLRAPSRLGFRV